jgi:hypothetical protein
VAKVTKVNKTTRCDQSPHKSRAREGKAFVDDEGDVQETLQGIIEGPRGCSERTGTSHHRQRRVRSTQSRKSLETNQMVRQVQADFVFPLACVFNAPNGHLS